MTFRQLVISRTVSAETARRSLFACGLLAVAFAATLNSSTAYATPVAFTLTSTASTLDLTAKGNISAASLTVTEQGGSKATRYSGTINTELSPTGIGFVDSAATAANQLGGILGTTPVNFRPGVGGTGSAAPGNYGVAITYPLATPIVLPAIPIGSYGTVSPGTITGAEIDIALRGMVLDFNSVPTFHPPLVGGGPTLFDATDVGVSFGPGGKADLSVGAILDITSITGSATLSAILRPVIIPVLQTAIASLVPTGSGITLNVYAGVGSTEVVVATGISQDLTTFGNLPNTTANSGKLERLNIGKANDQYKLTLPLNLDLAALVPDNPLVPAGDLTLNLTGQMVATAPYVVAIPEPSTLALAGVGLVGLAGYAARKRRLAA